MASSFASQIPSIIHIVKSVAPETVLDIGKGFGKYGFLIHEYAGIDFSKKVNPSLTMAQQSCISIDAVEVDADLMMPHLNNFYNHIYFGDILEIYAKLPLYDLIFMVDIVEHLDKEKAISLLKHFLSQGSNILIATPLKFFQQHLFESVFEEHISHWTIKDFEKIGFVEKQTYRDGAIYFLSKQKKDIVGFGSSFTKKLKRIIRAIINETK